MAPKPKISYDSIVTGAVNIVRENGVEAVNARSIAARLNCSVQPIFRNFSTMDELKAVVYKHAEEIYNKVMFDALESDGEGFLEMGLAYINFAKSEPNLFRLLFMSNVFNTGSAADIAGTTKGDEEVIDLIGNLSGLSKSESQELYTGIWFTTHGMASLLATNSCTLSDEEIKKILNYSYEGLVYSIKKQGEKIL
jgi:AcrR family transcriptional regulator